MKNETTNPAPTAIQHFLVILKDGGVLVKIEITEEASQAIEMGNFLTMKTEHTKAH